MGDGGIVGATRARLLDVAGVRVSQSYSRGEAWLLKQILLALRSPERLRELAEDPYYPKLLRKAQSMLSLADGSALACRTTETVQPAVAERTRAIQDAWRAAMESGEQWDCAAYAAANGHTYRAVIVATRSMRMAARKRTVVTSDVLYETYRVLKLAKLWNKRTQELLSARHGLGRKTAKRLMAGFQQRLCSDVPAKVRAIAHDVERAQALLRELEGAGYRVDNKEAAE